MRDFYDEKTQDVYRNTQPPTALSRHSTQSSLGVGRQLVEGVLNLLGHSDSDDSDNSGSSDSSNFSFPRRKRKRSRARKLSVSSDSSDSSNSSTLSPRRSISILSRQKSKKLKKRSRRSRLREPDFSQDFMLISLKSLHKPVIERHTKLSPIYRSIESTCGSKSSGDNGVWWLDIKSPTWDDMRSLTKVCDYSERYMSDSHSADISTTSTHSRRYFAARYPREVGNVLRIGIHLDCFQRCR